MVTKVEVLRNDLGSSNEKVSSIKIGGVELGECNPDGGDYDCTFYDCGKTHSFTATSSELEVEMTFTSHSWDCDCDKATWQCSRQETVSGRTAVEAVARFTLTEVMGSAADQDESTSISAAASMKATELLLALSGAADMKADMVLDALDDTCTESQCEACSKCMEDAVSSLERCWEDKPPDGGCINFDTLGYLQFLKAHVQTAAMITWCPAFLDSIVSSSCFSSYSKGCYLKLLCHSPKMCQEWTMAHCDLEGNTADSLLQRNMSSESNDTIEMTEAFLLRTAKATSDRTIELDSTTMSKCA